MRKTILIPLLIIAAVSVLAIGAAYVLPKDTPQPIADSSIPEPVNSEDTSDYPYMLRTYEGKLAVFTDDPVTPDMVFEVYVRTLPEQDQEELRLGIPVKTFEELNALVEDFIS